MCCFLERPCFSPKSVECADAPRLENPNLRIEREGKTIYLPGARFKYVSRPGYMLNGPTEINCSMGNWTSAPSCLGNIKNYFFWSAFSNEIEGILN